jgi:hypothetical protein
LLASLGPTTAPPEPDAAPEESGSTRDVVYSVAAGVVAVAAAHSHARLATWLSRFRSRFNVRRGAPV